MSFDRDWIAARIPHHGAMCLLESVGEWDAKRIICRTGTHRLADNPLRANGSLGIANGIEYAAQAIAIHGALLAGNEQAPAAGFLTSVRDVQWTVDRLDEIAGDLRIESERLMGDQTNVMYRFCIEADGQLLMSGRASVILDATEKERKIKR